MAGACAGVGVPPEVATSFNSVNEIITSQIDRASDMASAAADAMAGMGEVSDALDALGEISGMMQVPGAPPTPEAGSLPPTDVEPYNEPDAPRLEMYGSVSLPSVPQAPDTAIEEVDIDLDIAKPQPLVAAPPDAVSVDEVAIPQSPDILLPAEPALAGISIPDIPTINLPTLDDDLGDAPVSPDVTFAYQEVEYSSDLLDSLRTWLARWVDGAATGIDADVERAIWDRGRDREAAGYGQAHTQILNDMAGRGFPVPPGMAAVMAFEAGMKMRGAISTFNRDVAIKQAELEQQNRQFAFKTALDLEVQLINYASSRAARELEAAKFTVESLLEVYKAAVTMYNANVEAFKARADVYRTQLQGELAKLDIYKAQIEGARLVTEINKSAVDVYRAQIDAVKATIEVYNAQVEGAKVAAQVAALKIEGFKARVDAYKALVESKTAEFEAYEAEVRAEVAKIDILKARADVLTAQASVYGTTVRGEVDLKTLEVEIEKRIPLEAFKANVAAYEAAVRGATAAVESSAEVARTRLQAYTAHENATAEHARVGAAIYSASGSIAEAQARVEVARSSAIAQIEVSSANLRSEMVRATAQVYSTLAAGAMAGVNVHAGANASAGVDSKVSAACIEQYTTTTRE